MIDTSTWCQLDTADGMAVCRSSRRVKLNSIKNQKRHIVKQKVFLASYVDGELLYYVRTQLTYTYVESVWYFRLVGFQGDCIGMILIYGDKWASTTYNSGTRVWKSTRT